MFYVFHGDDALSRDEALRKLISRLGDADAASLNLTRLDGRSLSLDELRRHCDTLPFFTNRRLIIVRGLLARLSGNAERAFREGLLAYLPELPPTTRLVFVEDRELPKRHPVVKLAKQAGDGYVRLFATPRGRSLARWIRARARQLGGEMTPQAVEMLGAFVGDDLYRLNNEIQKLVSYVDGQRPVNADDVIALTPDARQASIFDMVDAIGRRDGRTASRIYHRLLAAGDHPLALLGMITRQFRLMIQVKELAPRLGTAEAIARELRQNPYPIKKILAQSRNYSFAQLHVVYRRLLETDLAIKSGQMAPVLALDLLIAGLSRIS